MNSFNPQELITRAFIRLRQKGFNLGVGELLIAEEAVEGGFGENPQELAETLKILWCHSPSEQSQFDPIWESLLVTPKMTKSDRGDSAKSKSGDDYQQESEIENPSPLSSTPNIEPENKPESELASLPIQAPPTAMENEDNSALQAYYPITHRSMAYSWRYLRRLVADGPVDILDWEETIKQVTKQGFYLAPVYRRRKKNHAHLLLLLDQNGSMTPCHGFNRDLVETACNQSSLQPEKINVFYFHNVPAENVYKDLYLTEPTPFQEILTTCDNETSVLIVSDAGAARGYRTLERIRATTRFLLKLKRYTSLIAWLNPIPKERWIGSSAEIIANLVPMFQMDKYGLSNAIDIIRGQSYHAFI
ncbi:MAG: VWA containing CoxE family protein [Symploca sp. SIO2E9]|nr:VWA containing CoxE family protein [Symploca sp. SIO2E9]